MLPDGVQVSAWRKLLHPHVVEQHLPKVTSIIFIDVSLGQLLTEMLYAFGRKNYAAVTLVVRVW